MESEMNTGMLWFDNDPKIDINTKILKASEYYQKKYGQKPDVCFVNPAMNVGIPPKNACVEIQTNQMILPDHFWLGVKHSPMGA